MVAPMIAAEGINKISQQMSIPVMGRKLTTIRKTKTKTVIEEKSFQVRGWELLGAGALAIILFDPLDLKSKTEGDINLWDVGKSFLGVGGQFL